MPRPLLWSGPRAFLVQCGTLAEVMQLHAILTAQPFAGQREVLAAAETVLVSFADPASAQTAAPQIAGLEVDLTAAHEGATHTVDVVYNGEDLADVAELTGLGVDGLISWHTSTSWLAGFGGFAPGFSYLIPHQPDEAIAIPRRETPRTAVPAGAVALAGTFSAVYPRSSPGGWQLLGTTAQAMWDTHRDPPALLTPGDTVQFRAVREHAVTSNSTAQPAEPVQAAGVDHGLVVADPGMLSLIQDDGRPGHGDLGVPASGAADSYSLQVANRIVGNRPDAAAIEILAGNAAFQAHGHHVIALTGANTPAHIVAAPSTDSSKPAATRRVDFNRPVGLYDGETLKLEAPTAGLRTYLAVRGGIEVSEELGSSATDTLSGLGPEPLAADQLLPVHAVASTRPVGLTPSRVNGSLAGSQPIAVLPSADALTELRVIPGPRDDWFSDAGHRAFTGQDWTVTAESNRIGVRCQGTDPVEYAPEFQGKQLASEGMVSGAIQIPPAGQPVIFLADHPVTGGYPVIGVIHPDDLRLAAQLPPGARIRFRLDSLGHP